MAPSFRSSLLSMIKEPVTRRYAIVVLVGFAVDVAVALAMRGYFGAPIVLAAITGFIVAFFLTFYAHYHWTFRSNDNDRLFRRRFGRYTLSALTTISTRTLVLAPMMGLDLPLIADACALAAAAGCSLIVNFLLTRYFAFNTEEPSSTTLRRVVAVAILVCVAASVIYMCDNDALRSPNTHLHR
ncbi:MAG: GtrA family protein [Pseudomonadota bacterium]